MARLISKPIRPQGIPRIPNIRLDTLAEARVNQGMITTIDPVDIENSALQLAKNAVVRYDRMSRRPGTTLLTPVKPNSNPVLRVAHIKQQDGIAYTIRMTPQTLHSLGVSSWEAFVGDLIGGRLDRFQTAVVLNRFVFANNGMNSIQIANLEEQTFKKLGNAPNYRYITGFYNRVVGFARRDQNEVEVGWCGDGNLEEWDSEVDETAGSTPLLESPADLSDFGTGIFSGPNIMILLRERSIWLATKQPIPQNPFYFTAAIPNLGCDTPFSAIWMGDGLAWLDRRTATAYAFAPGAAPEPIGRPIEKSLIKDIDNPEAIFSGYNSPQGEYTIYLPQPDNYVIGYCYNRKEKAWTQQEYYGITCDEETILATGGVSIDELVGDIDSLPGTIDSLSPPSIIIRTRAYGRDDGEILSESETAATDPAETAHPTGFDYETVLVSKVFETPSTDIFISRLEIEYQSQDAGPFIIEYSLNGGATDGSWTAWRTITPTVLNEPKQLILKKLLRTKRFAFRIRSTSSRFDILSYAVKISRAGESPDRPV